MSNSYVTDVSQDVVYGVQFTTNALGVLILGFVEVCGKIVDEYECQMYLRTTNHEYSGLLPRPSTSWVQELAKISP